MKIGEFSRLGRVTVRALRHYEEIDLLTPEIVDRDTGYRYYSVGQLQKIFNITKLKSMGYSLEEIRDLWDDDQHFPTVESLEKKIRKCEDELAVLKERKRMLKAVVALPKRNCTKWKKFTLNRFRPSPWPAIEPSSLLSRTSVASVMR